MISLRFRCLIDQISQWESIVARQIIYRKTNENHEWTKAIKISILEIKERSLKKLCCDQYYAQTLNIIATINHQVNFDDTSHAKCIDFTCGDEIGNGITCASGYATLTLECHMYNVVETSVYDLFRDKLQSLRTSIFVLAWNIYKWKKNWALTETNICAREKAIISQMFAMRMRQYYCRYKLYSCFRIISTNSN